MLYFCFLFCRSLEEAAHVTYAVDASDEFWDIGHSEQAMDDMKQYIVGQLTKEECEKLKEAASSSSVSGGGSMMPVLVFILLLAAGGAAFMFT